MARQNRVAPDGELLAVEARGTLMGNRGCLHDQEGVIRRKYQGRRWIICVLRFKGRRQVIMAPGRYTQLFFLDEATALAAGHRPCAECQRERFKEFRSAWARGNPELSPSNRPSADEIDDALHAQRITPDDEHAAFSAPLDDLPNGCFVMLKGDSSPYLVHKELLLRWSPAGYDSVMTRPAGSTVEVLTPRATVRALAAGYQPLLHESANRS